MTRLLFLMVLLATSGSVMAAGFRYGVPVRYDDGQAKELPDFSIRYLGYFPKVVHVGGVEGRSFDFGSHDFEVVRGEDKTVVHWSEGTGVIAAVPFDVGGRHFVLELRQSALAAAGAASAIPAGSLLLWKGADYERKQRGQMDKSSR
ncbi:MAG: hypothetical protein ABIW82_03470 [Dokdonella sp.]